MIINFKVRNMTIEAVPCFEPIRQGSEDILRVAFEFDKTWDEFTTKYIYFASEGYAEFFELIGNEYDVPKYYAAQEYFALQLSGHNGTAKIPTNKIVVTLDPSGEIWTSEPPESMAEGIQQLIDAAEEAKRKADEAIKKANSIIDENGQLTVKTVVADIVHAEQLNIGKEKDGGVSVALDGKENDNPVIEIGGQLGDKYVIIRGIAEPRQATDAVPKFYVENLFKNASGTKIPIVEAIPEDMKDGDIVILEDGDDGEDDDGDMDDGDDEEDTDPVIPEGDFVTEEEMQEYVGDSVAAVEKKIPTKASQLENDAGFLTEKDLPSGGGSTPELLFERTYENVGSIAEEIDFKGHKNFTIILAGTKGENAISINSGTICIGDLRWSIMYYTKFLSAITSAYSKGSMVEDMIYIGNGVYKINYKQSDVGDVLKSTFQGNSSAIPYVRESYLTAGDNTDGNRKNDGLYISFSESVTSVTLKLYGY